MLRQRPNLAPGEVLFSKLSTSRTQFAGKILNSDPASSYFPFNTPTVFVFLPVLHLNRSFEISMTIALIYNRACLRVKILYSGVYDMPNVFVFVFVYFRPYLSFFHFAFASVAGRAWSGYFLTAAL